MGIVVQNDQGLVLVSLLEKISLPPSFDDFEVMAAM